MNQKEYLEKKIKPIMENLIFQLVLERPEDPTAFMVDWLQKTAGYNLNGLKPEEKEEFANLKREIVKYRAKDKNNLDFEQSEEEDIVYEPSCPFVFLVRPPVQLPCYVPFSSRFPPQSQSDKSILLQNFFRYRSPSFRFGTAFKSHPCRVPARYS